MSIKCLLIVLLAYVVFRANKKIDQLIKAYRNKDK